MADRAAPDEPDSKLGADAATRVRTYHERTKHRYERFAPGPGYLDWASQPDPFRTYAGAPRLELPLVAGEVSTTYDGLYGIALVEPRPLELRSLAAFLELSLGLTAWKEYEGSRWALRANPSSGNLHPTEGYLVLGAAGAAGGGAAGVPAGVHHYVSRDHVLEHRCAPQPGTEPVLPAGGFLIGFSSIHWRESWKYGERAFRYCQHDVGHALACARLAAASLGWSVRLLDGFGDDRVARILGLRRAADFAHVDELEQEHPDLIALVTPARGAEADAQAAGCERAADGLVEGIAEGRWRGAANGLSSSHRDWTAIHDVASATWKPPSLEWDRPFRATPVPQVGTATAGAPLAIDIIRHRRSAVALDGATGLSRDDFYGLLERLMPRVHRAPWDTLPFAPRVHLALFVHRVHGLEPGVYLLERTDAVHDELRRQLGPKALWSCAPGCPDELPLACIGQADVQRAATSVSCGQDIAGQGAFSLGMLAEFRQPLAAAPWDYRRLYWETGVIGQVLYLEAEARGVRGTGIGCFFDDPVHDVVGLEGDLLQSLYHFTIGGPVEDERLVTRPAYEHLGPRGASSG